MKKERMDKRLAALRELMASRHLEAVFLYGRENSRYLSDFSGTTSEILLTQDEAWIYVDSRYKEQAQEQCLSYTVKQVPGPLREEIYDYVRRHRIRRLGYEGEALSARDYLALHKALPDVELENISQDLAQLRQIKDAEELDYIRKAVLIADEAFAETWPCLHAGMSELEAAALLEYNMKKRGAAGPSFETICASGLRGAMPHGVASEKILEDGDMVTMDFGCIYKGYCSDITRSFFIGHSNEKLIDIYNVVLKAQINAEQNIKAGMTGQEGDRFARSIIEEAGYGPYFGHGLGHSLGLEIHELPSLSPKWDKPLPAGVLLTVEPGIYVPGLGGVRIEDTCLLHEDGLEILTSATKELLITGRS